MLTDDLSISVVAGEDGDDTGRVRVDAVDGRQRRRVGLDRHAALGSEDSAADARSVVGMHNKRMAVDLEKRMNGICGQTLHSRQTCPTWHNKWRVEASNLQVLKFIGDFCTKEANNWKSEASSSEDNNKYKLALVASNVRFEPELHT